MKKLIAAMLLTCAVSTAYAQETPDTFRLREVVVSATRLPQSTNTVSAAVSVIRHTEFEQLGLRNAADVLRTVSGAALVQSASYGSFTSMFLRGGESDYVQVLIDGVQINSPGEHFDFSGLSLENVERIEVVKGPVSVLYGSDAVAGVVQLFTKGGASRPRAQMRALAGQGSKVGANANGSFNAVDLSADITGGSNAFIYSVGASHFGTDGSFAYNNEHQLTSGTARLGFRGERSTANVSARAARNRFHYPTDGSGNLVDRNQFQNAEAVTFGVDAAHNFTARTELRGQLSWNRNDNLIDDSSDDAADTLGFYAFNSDETFTRTSIDLRLNQDIGKAVILTLGGEYEAQSQNASSLAESSFGDFPAESDNERNNTAGYLQLLGNYGSLSLQAGARIDRNQEFGDFFTYRAGASAQLTSLLRVRASAGTGFKEPRFFEQFSEGFGAIGNPNLEPEQSRSYEIGADLGRRGWSVGATAFRQRFRDLIQYSFTPLTADSVNYINVGDVAADGLELESRVVHRAFTLRGAITFLETEVKDAGDVSDPLYQPGERLIRRPARTASLSVLYGTNFNIGAVFTHVGERDDLYYDESFTPVRVELASYTKLDLSVRSPEFRSVRGMLRVENVLNEGYEEIRNFPARGRVVFIGLAVDR